MKKRIIFLNLIALLFVSSCSEELIFVESASDEEVIQNDNEDQGDNSNNIDAIVNDILLLVNQHRERIGKSKLILNTVATELAIKHTQYMISQNEISHDNFSNRFKELQQKVNAKSAGENVAAGYTTAESVMDAWLNSEGHKANIEGDFTHIGIAVIKSSQGRLYFTQLFYK